MKVKIIVIAMLLAAGTARAGFVADFYEDVKANTNVTEAGIIESQALNTVTGGGFVWRQKRREFVPFSVTPPSLKAGCGGIDLFLGAFSIPSREEFVSFLRSVGTALPGLAFQLALQTMAPDLNEQVSRFADIIRSYTNRYSDSCTAAQALLESTGAAEHMTRMVEGAKNALRSDGTASDQSEADKKVRDNGEAAITSAPTRKDSAGNVIDAPEINLTWALLKSGKFAGDTAKVRELREIMMTLAGTTIFRKVGTGENAVIEAQEIAGTDLLPVLFGEVRAGETAVRLECTEAERCLTVTQTEMAEMSLVDAMKTAAKNYRRAIKERNADLVTANDLYVLAGMSSVPMLKVLNLASVSVYGGLADDLINVYAEAAAYDAIIKAVEGLSADLKRAVASSSAASLTKEHLRHAEKLAERLAAIERALYERSDRLSQEMVRAAGILTQLEHVERALRTNDATLLQRTLPAAHYE